MEELLADVVGVLVTVVEACGAAVILIGAVWASARSVWVGLRRGGTSAFVPVQLTLGRFLALGLEFQLAGDVLRTAVAPSFRELGQLAASRAGRGRAAPSVPEERPRPHSPASPVGPGPLVDHTAPAWPVPGHVQVVHGGGGDDLDVVHGLPVPA